MGKKRSKYNERLKSSRDVGIVLVYADNYKGADAVSMRLPGCDAGKRRKVQPFYGPLHELASLLKIDVKYDGDKRWWDGRRISEPTAIIEPRVGLLDKVGKIYAVIGAPTLFTKTSKMRAPSWSLPAGPPQVGGTCVAAGVASVVEDDDLFVCHGCYATDGNYRYGTKQLSMMVMRTVTEQAVKRGIFTAMMSKCIEIYKSKVRKDSIKAIVDGKTVSKAYKLDTSYFRIHDSGDMWWQPGYLEAWIEVARRCPDVRFWAPMRDWVLGDRQVRAVQQILANAPPNFILRPSAVHVGDVAPNIDEFAAGTSVSFDAVEEGIAQWDCPAYDHEQEVSCTTARQGKGCRFCWDQPNIAVNYQPHGSEMTRKKLVGAVRKSTSSHRNPPDLAETYQDYLDDPTSNPSPEHGFDVWLAANGFDTAQWDEAEWYKMLRHLGLDDDSISSYLSSTAERQP